MFIIPSELSARESSQNCHKPIQKAKLAVEIEILLFTLFQNPSARFGNERDLRARSEKPSLAVGFRRDQDQ
jgi:hypothetical protein